MINCKVGFCKQSDSGVRELSQCFKSFTKETLKAAF